MSAFRRSLMLLTLLAALVSAGFVRLGFWQLDRAEWKSAWLTQWESALQAPAHDLSPADLSASSAVDAETGRDGDRASPVSRHVRIRGSWLDQPLILLDNQRRGERIGMVVYRLLQSEQLPLPLLVDVGWLPWPAQRTLPSSEQLIAATRIPDTADGTAFALQGLLVAWPGQGIALGGHEPQIDDEGRLLLTRLDADTIRATMMAGSRQQILQDRVLRLDPDVQLGFRREQQALPNTLLPEQHRGYAVQWFALAATVLTTYGVLLWKALKKRRRS